jgi:hypothetical protein
MKEPLKAFGPDGKVEAYSYNGGDNWSKVPKKEPKPKLKEYKYNIAAISPVNYEKGNNPSFERRIINSFAPLGDINILAGWGPLPEVLSIAPNSLDAIVVPFGSIGNTEEDIKNIIQDLRKIAKKIFLDLDMNYSKSDIPLLVSSVSSVDAVLVPSDQSVMGLRKYNANTYCVPPTINNEIWKGATRKQNEVVKIAVQPTQDRHVKDAIKWMADKYPVELYEDDWENRSIYDEPDFYTGMDVVIVGDAGRTNTAILSPMIAGCCIIANVSYSKAIMHNHSGILVAQRGPSAWRKEFSHIALDSRTRTKMQAGARERSRLFTGRSLVSRLAMPYRVVLG